MSEETKAILELKISGSGISEGSLTFELLVNKGTENEKILVSLTLFCFWE